MAYFRRQRPLLYWLAVLGLFAQLCLPVAHAMAMAQAVGTGAAAFCGAENAELTQKLRAVAPPELRAALDTSGDIKSAHADCPPCGACASGMAPLAGSPSLSLLRSRTSKTPAPTAQDPAAVATSPPPARGPPSQS
jgi:hypothetical protein